VRGGEGGGVWRRRRPSDVSETLHRRAGGLQSHVLAASDDIQSIYFSLAAAAEAAAAAAAAAARACWEERMS